MKSLALAIGLFFLSISQSFASLVSCGSGTTQMTNGSTELFGNSFTSVQSFSDCYSFSINSSVDAFGGTLTIDPLSYLDISVSSVTLSGAGLVTSLFDTTPGVFSFSNLFAGTYQLIISGQVARGTDWSDVLPLPVGYVGSVTVGRTAVPEPASLAMLGLGLMGVAAMRRRRR